MEGNKYDTIIVGGGHNGLICAAYLAKAGAKVLVLEKRPIVGGACVTEETWPGFKINTFSYVCGLLRRNIVEDLQLTKFGYDPIVYDPQYFLPFPNGKYIITWVDLDKSVKEVAKFSEKDARAYPKFMEYFEQMVQLIEPAMLAPPLPIKDLLSLFEGPEAEDLIRRLLLMSAKDFLDEWFESEEVKTALCTSGVIGTFAGPRTPGTAYVLAHHTISNLNEQPEVWGLSKGGMGMITQAIAKVVAQYGGEILVDTPVRKILVKDGKTTGVETASGKKFEARAVASGVDANVTFNKLVGKDNVAPEFLQKVNHIKYRGACVKFNAALDELPNFKALPGLDGPQHRAVVDIAPSMDYLDKAYFDAVFGKFSDRPFMETVYQSVLDPQVAPPGKHTMTCFVQYMPEKLKTGTWEDNKPDIAETIISTIAEYAPNIRKAIRNYQLLGPQDFESMIGLTGGSIFQGDMSPDQIFSFRPIPGWSQYRMPIEGLYLCGSAAHPGGGVLGAPGYLASNEILKDLKIASI